MKHLKTNEEYRFFKVKKTNVRPTIKDPSGDWDYHTVGSEIVPNEKDPNEPFFSFGKWNYEDKLEDKNKQKMDQLNDTVSRNLLDKMGFTKELEESFLKLNYPHGRPMNMPYRNKYEGFISVSIENYAIRYYESEKDYIATTYDYTGKIIKKRFDNLSDVIDWFYELKNTYQQKIREEGRRVQENIKNKK